MTCQSNYCPLRAQLTPLPSAPGGHECRGLAGRTFHGWVGDVRFVSRPISAGEFMIAQGTLGCMRTAAASLLDQAHERGVAELEDRQEDGE